MIEDWLWLIALIILVIMILVHYDWEYFFHRDKLKKLKKLQNLLNENNSLEKTAENIHSGLQNGNLPSFNEVEEVIKQNKNKRSFTMDLEFKTPKWLKKALIAGVLLIVAIVLCTNSCSIVQQRERGVKYVFGKVEGDVRQPGLILHAPFVTEIKKYSIAPKTFVATFPVGPEGAITKDMQTVGTSVNVKYAYDEARIMDIAMRYGDSVVESAMKSNIIASVKEVVGQYSIYELVEKQPEVTAKVAQSILARMQDYPITISQTTITNWDWSDDFDKQIKETANRAQEVKKAEQDLKLAEQTAQKQVKEAEAKKQAMQFEAEALLIKAQNEAEAKKAEADGIAYYNAKVAQNMTVQQQQWKHEEQMKYYETWNGILVPQYVPLTAAGGIVNLPASADRQ